MKINANIASNIKINVERLMYFKQIKKNSSNKKLAAITQT